MSRRNISAFLQARQTRGDMARPASPLRTSAHTKRGTHPPAGRRSHGLGGRAGVQADKGAGPACDRLQQRLCATQVVPLDERARVAAGRSHPPVRVHLRLRPSVRRALECCSPGHAARSAAHALQSCRPNARALHRLSLQGSGQRAADVAARAFPAASFRSRFCAISVTSQSHSSASNSSSRLDLSLASYLHADACMAPPTDTTRRSAPRRRTVP